MHKLTLNLDALQVASFETDPAPGAARGTVAGREADQRCPYTYCPRCTMDVGCTQWLTCRAPAPVLP